MRLTTRSEYALLALLCLARHDTSAYVTAQTVAKAQAIPLAYLEQLLRALKQSHLVVSSKGQKGGFRLARPAHQISIAEVIRLFDGALAPTHSVSEHFYAATPLQKEARMLQLLKDIRDYAARKLEATSLADLV